MSGEFPTNAVASFGRPGFLGNPKKKTSGATVVSSASVHNSGNLLFATGSFNAPAWDTKDFDNGGFWNAGSPDRFTITTPGVYLFTGAVTWVANATGQRICGFFKNGSALILFGGSTVPAAAGTVGLCGTYLFNLVASDFIQFVVFQSSGGNLNMTGNFVPFFACCSVP